MAVAAALNFETRVPGAVTASLVLHAAGLAGFLTVMRPQAGSRETVISNVELMIEARKENKVSPRARLVKPPSMKDFLKLALPSIPKARPSAPLELKPVETRRTLMDLAKPKIEDRGRLKNPAKLASLDLSRERSKLAKIDQPLVENRSAPRALPKLEEIGFKKAPRKVVEMAALAEERRRTGPRAMPGMDLKLEDRGAPKTAAPLLGKEPEARRDSDLSKLAGMLSSDRPALRLEPRRAEKPKFESIAKVETPKLAPRPERTALKKIEKKKAVEIEGPLSGRKVTAHSLPRFPEWARAQGLIEAEVEIKFYVAPTGNVIGGKIQVVRSSGYGRLDRLVMDHLMNWRFEPLPFGGGIEWGIITFRFLEE